MLRTRSIELEANVYVLSEVGCFRSSKGFSQATPSCGVSPRLILLPFGGIPNSPGFEENASGVPCGFESDRGTSTVCGLSYLPSIAVTRVCARKFFPCPPGRGEAGDLHPALRSPFLGGFLVWPLLDRREFPRRSSITSRSGIKRASRRSCFCFRVSAARILAGWPTRYLDSQLL
jgi:hypothetical protein